MATLGSPSPPSSPSLRRRRKSWARRCERYCCNVLTYFPLAFVYGLTSWSVWVEAGVGFHSEKLTHGSALAYLGIILFLLLNASYTAAVFTDPGSPMQPNNGYSTLPTSEGSAYNSFTVKSTGEIRYCKKCQTKKPDRSHHCSTCRRCVLKMDHHCPWLATCVGLRNYKAFMLFLIYLCFFCWTCFVTTSLSLWGDILSENQIESVLMPVNTILLAVLSGIIGLVITGFTSWHVYLAGTGMTTIEKLEKTRYITPIKKTVQHHLSQRGQVDPETGRMSIGDQLREIHANAIPSITRPEEGEERPSPTFTPAQYALRQNWAEMEQQRERDRYAAYLDEKESSSLPHAFDLGWKRNLGHIFGRSPWLWGLPVPNTTGDGWSWEPSPKWLRARENIRTNREAEERMLRERAASIPTDIAPWAQISPTFPSSGNTGASSYDNRGEGTQLQTFTRKPAYPNHDVDAIYPTDSDDEEERLNRHRARRAHWQNDQLRPDRSLSNPAHSQSPRPRPPSSSNRRHTPDSRTSSTRDWNDVPDDMFEQPRQSRRGPT